MTSILAIVGGLVTLGSAWLIRRWARKDDKRNQIAEQKEENREAIAAGASGDLLDQRINRLPPH